MCVWYLVELAFGLTLWAEKDRMTPKGHTQQPYSQSKYLAISGSKLMDCQYHTVGFPLGSDS